MKRTRNRPAAIVGVATGFAAAALIVAGILWTRPPEEQALPSLPDSVALAAPVDRSTELARAAAAARMAPRDASMAVEAGALAGDMGRHEEALAWFQRAAAIDPKLPAAASGQGQMWMELGRPGLAAAAYERALRLAPNEPRLYLELARAYTYVRDFDAAVRYAREAERRSPNSTEVALALSRIYLETLDTDTALRYADQACRLEPDAAENWATRGYVLMRSRRFSEADAAYRKALALDPGHRMANLLLAQTLIEWKKTPQADRQAFALLSRARLSDPDNADALRVQGQILLRAGDLPQAASLLRRAREATPRDPDVLLALGQALVRSGASEEGFRLISESQKLGPRTVAFSGLEAQARRSPDAGLTLRLAEVYRRQGLYDSAIHVLERALRRQPENAALRRELASVKQAADRLTPAVNRATAASLR